MSSSVHPNDRERTPKVSVQVPVYNAERYLESAMESILTQTFDDFELVVIDDGSTDGSRAILERLADRDGRIRLTSRENRGVTATRNELLELARGEYIAIMDSDDLSLPDRFAEQVRFLDEHPDHVAVGTRSAFIDPDGDVIRNWLELESHEQIDAAHMAGDGGALIHPSTMIRRQAVVDLGGYRHAFEPAEDYDLFLRLGEVGKLANLPRVLFEYRQHLSSFGYAQRERQRRGARLARAEARERRGIAPRDEGEDCAGDGSRIRSLRQVGVVGLGRPERTDGSKVRVARPARETARSRSLEAAALRVARSVSP